mgnify:CR=1 FL=1
MIVNYLIFSALSLGLFVKTHLKTTLQPALKYVHEIFRVPAVTLDTCKYT